MAGDVLGGALIGGLMGGLVGGAFALYAKLTGKPLGRKQVQQRERPQTVPAPATWKTETKRILIGLVWFLVIWLAARIVCGAAAGILANSQVAHHAASYDHGFNQGYSVGQRAGAAFFQQYGLLVLLGSLVAAVVGTMTGFLPGTRRTTMPAPTSAPSPEGQWPPPPSGTP